MRGAKALLILSILHFTQAQSLLEALLAYFQEGDEHHNREPEDVDNVLPEYDFVIVGAGTAGCVLANRLTEISNWTVLLIEAGRRENFIMDIPAIATYLQFTNANWKYKTHPSDKYCLAMDNHQCNWPRGKVVGGSSVLNSMLYTRGNRRDYDNWARMGNTGWSYEEILPYFKKLEDFTVPESQDPKYHGKGGYLSVGYSPYRTNISKVVLKAASQMGWPYVDYDGATQTGISYTHATLKNGIRASASRSYLHPIRDRQNFFMKKYTTVTKILIDSNTKRAYGVNFVNMGRAYSVRAKKELILSAGAINSPQLLMLSGIGPKKHLQRTGIPVIQNLKVGYNLMDHFAIGGITFLIKKPYSYTVDNYMNVTEVLKEFLLYHQGPLSIAGGVELLSFHDLKNPNDTDGWPDLEFVFGAASLASEGTVYKTFGVTDEIYNQIYGPHLSAESFMVYPMLLRPKSKGRLMLRGKDYRLKPYLIPNYLDHPDDIETLVQGARLLLKLSEQPAFQELGPTLLPMPVAGCSNYTFNSDKYWECMARHFTFTIYHQSGTCKMGPASYKDAVVDPRLRVHGIKNLRVIDASIMPEIPAGHTNGPTYMIAEKGADMIKEDWGFL